MGKRLKAQSAMEYLMTYGWAILIIAVVLGALFSLGVFSGSSMLGTSCIASPGYYCQNPVLSTSGALTFSFGQNTGATEYNAIIWVANQSTTPTTSSPFFTTKSFVGNYSYSSPSGLASGQTITVSILLPGYSSAAIGTPFSGYVWLAYNSMSASGQANLLAKVATIVVKAS